MGCNYCFWTGFDFGHGGERTGSNTFARRAGNREDRRGLTRSLAADASERSASEFRTSTLSHTASLPRAVSPIFLRGKMIARRPCSRSLNRFPHPDFRRDPLSGKGGLPSAVFSSGATSRSAGTGTAWRAGSYASGATCGSEHRIASSEAIPGASWVVEGCGAAAGLWRGNATVGATLPCLPKLLGG